MAQSDLQQVQDTQRSLEDTLLQRMAYFESRLAASTSVTPEPTLAALRMKFQEFKELVQSILTLCQQQIAELTRSVDSLETRNRRKVLLISGVSEVEGEDLSSTITELIKTKLTVPISAGDLKACHRLGERKNGHIRPVLVRFRSVELKSLVWRKKTMFKGTSYTVSEFLTRSRQSVFASARVHFGIRSCWTMEGVINIKLPSGTRAKITTKTEIAALVKQYPVISASTASEQLQAGTGSVVSTVTDSMQAGKKILTRKQAHTTMPKTK